MMILRHFPFVSATFCLPRIHIIIQDLCRNNEITHVHCTHIAKHASRSPNDGKCMNDKLGMTQEQRHRKNVAKQITINLSCLLFVCNSTPSAWCMEADTVVELPVILRLNALLTRIDRVSSLNKIVCSHKLNFKRGMKKYRGDNGRQIKFRRHKLPLFHYV